MQYLFTIHRDPGRDDGTFGRGTLSDGRDDFSVIERPPRDNQHGRGCIPAGVYLAYQHTSAHFGMNVYELQHVRGREGRPIEINWGVWAGDPMLEVPLYCDMLGDIAIGLGVGEIQPPDASYKLQRGLLLSRQAMAEFMQRTQGVGIMVEILEPQPLRLVHARRRKSDHQ